MAKKGLKVIGAGPRELTDYSIVEQAIKDSGFEIAEIVHGDCRGADKLFQKWAENNKVKFTKFPAEWTNLSQPGAIIKSRYNQWKKVDEKYNANAGFYRNQEMADYADALIAIGGDTPGTGDMIEKAKKAGLQLFISGQNKDSSEHEYHF